MTRFNRHHHQHGPKQLEGTTIYEAKTTLTYNDDGNKLLRNGWHKAVREDGLQDVERGNETKSSHSHRADQREVDPQAHECREISKRPFDVDVLATRLRY